MTVYFNRSNRAVDIDEGFSDMEMEILKAYFAREEKSITVVEETKDVFIEFDAYLVDFGDEIIMMLFQNCKAIGFSVEGKSDDDDYMTVGVLLGSPFEGYF